MSEDELKAIVARDEETRVEFKLESEKQQALAEVLGAMANSQGGWLLVGVADDGAIVGVNRPKTVIDRLYSAAANVEPSLAGRVTVESVRTSDGLSVVVAFVPTGLPAIHAVAGVYRLRVGSYNKIITFDQAQALAYRRGILHHEQSPVQHLKLEDLDNAAIEAYLHRRLNDYSPQVYAHLSRFEILRNLGCALLDEGQPVPNVAAALFFSPTPDFWVPGAQIIAARFAGSTSDRVLDRLTIRGSLPQMIEAAARFVEKNIRHPLQLPARPGGSLAAQEMPEYPIAAYREMIVNLLAHRDYYNLVPAHLMIFDDRLVAENPGGLLPGLTLNTLENRHRPRNPRLVEMLHTLGYVERFGSGIGRMRSAMLEAGLPVPGFEADENYFRVTLRNTPALEIASQTLPTSHFVTQTELSPTVRPVRPLSTLPAVEGHTRLHENTILEKLPLVRLKARQIEALRYLIRTGRITNTNYRAVTGLAEDATLADLKELLELHILQKIGTSGRSVYYVLHPTVEQD